MYGIIIFLIIIFLLYLYNKNMPKRYESKTEFDKFIKNIKEKIDKKRKSKK